MKSLLLVLIGCLSLFAYSYVLACGSCDNTQATECQQSNPCGESINRCQCADVNSDSNPCISQSRYCQLFGNVGDNKFTDY